MECPFCNRKLKEQSDEVFTDAWCDRCDEYDFARYRAKYFTADDELYSEEFAIGEFFVRVNHRLKLTIIHKLEACILTDSFRISQAVKFNLKNCRKTLDKLRVWATFS